MEEVKIIGLQAEGLEIALSGDIDLGNAETFYQEVFAAYAASPADIIFDCKDLNFIDSTTLGTFVKILKKVKENWRIPCISQWLFIKDIHLWSIS